MRRPPFFCLSPVQCRVMAHAFDAVTGCVKTPANVPQRHEMSLLLKNKPSVADT